MKSAFRFLSGRAFTPDPSFPGKIPLNLENTGTCISVLKIIMRQELIIPGRFIPIRNKVVRVEQ
jgi:hypothetical protein